MKQQVIVGKRFSCKVPNGRKKAIEANFSGARMPNVYIMNSHSYTNPTITFKGDDGMIAFSPDTPIGMSVELQILENGEFLDLSLENEVSEVQSFRGSVIGSFQNIHPKLNYTTALTFDQAYWTRGISQIEIAHQLEDKIGPLTKRYELFSGVGFGGIMAIYLASGGNASDLMKFWVKELKPALSQTAAVFKGRRNPSPIKKALRKLFRDSRTGQDLTLNQLKREIFIPLMDINGKCLSVTKTNFPSMMAYEAATLSVIDPVEFDSKPMIKGMSLLDSCIEKNPDTLLRVNNPGLNIDSIGCPSRIFNHGDSKRTLENMVSINQERNHRMTLMRQSLGGLQRNRFETLPIDHIQKFDFNKRAIQAAINSAFEVVQ